MALTLTAGELRDVQWLGRYLSAHQFSSERSHSKVTHFAEGFYHDGDLVLGDSAGAHVVEGDLSVTGNLMLGDIGGLWVTGRVTCENFVVNQFEAQVRGGVIARSSVIVQAHSIRQQLEPIHSPIVIRNAANGVRPPLSLVMPSTVVREGLLPRSMTQTFLSALKARRASVLLALRAGDSFDAMLNLKQTVSGLVSPRVASLLDAVRSGAAYEWAVFNGADALRVSRSDGSKQLAILSPAESKVLREKLASG